MQQKLQAFRQQIDSYDRQIQDLLQKRTAVVDQVGQLKKNEGLDVFIKPGREAEIIRRLIQEHKGSMQVRVIIQLWREIMMASLYVEQPFNIAVTDTIACRKLARDHFGCIVPEKFAATQQDAFQALVEKKCMFAVVPDYKPFLESLVTEHPDIKIVFKLPIFLRKNLDTDKAYVLGRIVSEETGDDTELYHDDKLVGRYANPSVLD